MRRLKKIVKWLVGIILGLAILLLLTVEIFDRYLSTERGTAWLYRGVDREVSIRETAGGLRYLSIGDAEKPALLLLHGAPGSLYDFLGFAKADTLYSRYRLLIPERPGYGADRQAEPSMIKQANELLEVLDGENQPAYLFGHSYGAPIVVIMGAIAPERVERIIPVSGQFDPDNEQTMRISYLLRFGIFKYLLPRWLWVSNVEKLTHPEAQRNALPYYGAVRVPTDVIHGDKDSLVPYENSPWLVENFLAGYGTLITMPGKDHAVHFSEVPYFVDYLLKLE